MGAFDRKRKVVPVWTHWFKLAEGPRPKAFWLKVGKEVSARRVPRRNETRVQEIVRQVEATWKG